MESDAQFDRLQNGASRPTQVIVKDEDARTLIAVVGDRIVAVGTMMTVRLLWAMARRWQLTLVGLAIGPVFVCVVGLQWYMCHVS
ncbi:hypothetical protein AZE42_11471 [Rhizopogon vesiculosus]|uniref:Uncharacterized protein n=1 Tax=Rhizopogon vesiculosus TaxID=180088 RepID=A0A1J8QDC9_9AGAM|nr:hypothetical protein AZE42_11471 [Rhizopogon vesiculosus]